MFILVTLVAFFAIITFSLDGINDAENNIDSAGAGDTIKYIYINSQHKNPLCRVASIDSTNDVGGKPDYDKEKYKEMILDAILTPY